MSNYKLAAAQFDYEYLGKTVDELSSIYGFPPAMLLSVVDGWERKLEVAALPDTKDITTFADALETRTRQQLGIVALYRQIEQQPLLAQIEKLFLEKTLTILQNLNHLDDKAATKITTLVNAIQTMQQRNPIALADKLKEDSAAGGIHVYVQNNVG